MRKITPQHSPTHYLRLEQASYASDSAEFLRNHSPDSVFLEEACIGGWKFILTRDERSGELAVSFKGTEPDFIQNPLLFAYNWISNGRRQAGAHKAFSAGENEQNHKEATSGFIARPTGELKVSRAGEFKARPTSEFKVSRAGKFKAKPTSESEQLGQMNEIISRWEAEYGPISVMTGHSAGCLPATTLGGDRLVISFNGHKAERGHNRINLAMSGDPLTQTKLLSVPRRYILVDKDNPFSGSLLEVHGLDGFFTYLQGKEWWELSSKFEKIEPVLTEPSEAMTRFSSDFEKQASEASSLLENQLRSMPAGGSSLNVDQIAKSLKNSSPEELIAMMEGSLASAKSLQQELDSQWKAAAKTKKWQTLLDFADQFAKAMYRDQQQSLAQTQHELQMKQWEREVKKHAENLRKTHHTQHVDLSLPQMQSAALHAIHPQGSISQRLQEMREFITEYKETQKTIQALLEERRLKQEQFNKLEANLDQLDSDIKRHYQRLLASQQKMTCILGKTGMALTLASGFLSLVPGGQLFSVSAAMAGKIALASKCIALAGTTADIWNTILGKRTAKKEDKYQRAVGRNLDIRAQLAQAASRNHQEMASIHSQKAQQRAILMAAADYSVPHEFREALEKEAQNLEDDISKQQDSIEDRESEIAKLKDQISDKEKEVRTRRMKARISTTKEKEKRRKKKLLKAEQELAELKVKLAVEEQDVSAERTNLKDLENDSKELDKLRKQEAQLAPIKDFFYEAVNDEVKRWEAIDEETRAWRKAVQKGLKDFSEAREIERLLVLNSMTAMKQFFGEFIASPITSGVSEKTGFNFGWGALQAQTAIGLGEQTYRLYDLWKSWEKADKSIKITLKKLKRTNPKATVMDALKMLGTGFCVTHYLIPILQMVTVGLAIFRLGSHLLEGSPRVESPEERMIKQFGEFLQAFCKHVDQQFVELHNRLDRDHHETIENLSLIRNEIGFLNQEVIETVENSRALIISEIQSTAYNICTAQVREKSMGISKSCSVFLEQSKSTVNRQYQLEILYKFLGEIKRNLEFETTFEVNNGLLLSRGRSGKQNSLKPTVDIGLIAQNPNIYTGLLASKIRGLQNNMPCLHLLLPLVDSFLAARQSARALGVKVESDPDFQKTHTILRDQAASIFELSNQMEAIIDTVRQKQDEIVSELRTRMQNIRQLKQLYRLQGTAYVIKHHRDKLGELGELGKLTGAKKFSYAKLFLNQKISSTYTKNSEKTPTTEHATQVFSHLFTDLATPTLPLTALGALVGGPIGACACTIPSIAIGTVFATYITGLRVPVLREAESVIRSTTFFDKKSVVDLTLSMKNKDNDAGLVHGADVKITIWLEKTGILASNVSCDLFISPITYSIRLSETREVDNLSAFKAVFHLSHSDSVGRNHKISVEPEGAITLAEVEKLNAALHLEPANYSESLLKLGQDYKAWMDTFVSGVELPEDSDAELPDVSGAVLPEDNIFFALRENAKVVLSKNSELVPLAFPSEMIESITSQFRTELNQMESVSVGTLLPFYDLRKDDRTGAWIIKIILEFVEDKQFANRTPYAELTVAEIDRETVTTFAAPTYQESDSTPNLNEMLLQVMYTGLCPSLGMPGDESVSLANGRWFAPSERSFPGFYALWEKEPSQAIHFSLRNYTSKLEHEATLVASGEKAELSGEIYGTLLRERKPPVLSKNYMEIFKKTRTGKAKLDNAKNELKEHYHLLWAYCCFVSSLDDVTLRASIERDLGILDPSSFDSIFDRISWGLEPAPITEEGINRFEALLENVPNQSLSELTQMMESLSR